MISLSISLHNFMVNCIKLIPKECVDISVLLTVFIAARFFTLAVVNNLP